MMDIEQILTQILQAVRERRQIHHKLCVARHYEEDDVRTVQRLVAERWRIVNMFKIAGFNDPENYDFRRSEIFNDALVKLERLVIKATDEECEMDLQVQAHGNGQNQALNDVAKWLDKSQLLGRVPGFKDVVEAIRTGAFLDQAVDKPSEEGSGSDTGGVPVESVQDETRNYRGPRKA